MANDSHRGYQFRFRGGSPLIIRASISDAHERIAAVPPCGFVFLREKGMDLGPLKGSLFEKWSFFGWGDSTGRFWLATNRIFLLFPPGVDGDPAGMGPGHMDDPDPPGGEFENYCSRRRCKTASETPRTAAAGSGPATAALLPPARLFADEIIDIYG